MFLQVHPLSVAPSVHVIGWGEHTMFHVRFKFLRRYVQLSLEFDERISFSYQVGFVIVDISKKNRTEYRFRNNLFKEYWPICPR